MEGMLLYCHDVKISYNFGNKKNQMVISRSLSYYVKNLPHAVTSALHQHIFTNQTKI